MSKTCKRVQTLTSVNNGPYVTDEFNKERAEMTKPSSRVNISFI